VASTSVKGVCAAPRLDDPFPFFNTSTHGSLFWLCSSIWWDRLFFKRSSVLAPLSSFRLFLTRVFSVSPGVFFLFSRPPLPGPLLFSCCCQVNPPWSPCPPKKQKPPPTPAKKTTPTNNTTKTSRTFLFFFFFCRNPKLISMLLFVLLPRMVPVPCAFFLKSHLTVGPLPGLPFTRSFIRSSPFNERSVHFWSLDSGPGGSLSSIFLSPLLAPFKPKTSSSSPIPLAFLDNGRFFSKWNGAVVSCNEHSGCRWRFLFIHLFFFPLFMVIRDVS